MKRRNLLAGATFFLFCGFSPVFANNARRASFFRAIQVDNVGGVEKLLADGVDPNLLNDHGETALCVALKEEAAKVASLLIADERTNVNLANKRGETPLMFAAIRGMMQQAQELMDRGALINKEGWQPLHYAACQPNAKMIGLLLENGANVDARSPNYTTPLMMAARYGSVNDVKILLDSGADTTLKNEQGLTAHDFAMMDNRRDVASLIQRATPSK